MIKKQVRINCGPVILEQSYRYEASALHLARSGFLSTVLCLAFGEFFPRVRRQLLDKASTRKSLKAQITFCDPYSLIVPIDRKAINCNSCVFDLIAFSVI